MRVLGIDPGLTRCGLGVVDGSVGRPLTLVDVNVIRTSSDLPVAQRLVSIEKGIDAWLDEHRPDAVAVERVFARSDVSTVMGTAQASGIALVCAARRGLPVALHTPSEVKAAVTGSGRADKARPQRRRAVDRRRSVRAGHGPAGMDGPEYVAPPHDQATTRDQAGQANSGAIGPTCPHYPRLAAR